MKFTKKLKAMAVALPMLVLSTVASITGTVAWFTANNIVNATGMNIQAETENGIVIANETHIADSDWVIDVTASHNGGTATFIPTSTANLATWYHGISKKADDGQYQVDRDTFNAPADGDGDGIYTATSTRHFTSSAKNVYLLNNFYVQASAKTEIADQDIFIENIAVTGNTGSANLDKSLRVGLMVGDSFVGIYAPLSGATLTYNVNGSSTNYDVTAIDVSANNDSNKVCDNIDIPAYTTNGASAIKFSVFVYFEGEDANHKSANITNSLDTLSLSFSLKNADHVVNP